MSTDPLAKLVKFTPATALDPAELLFAAGRASARTPWGSKAAVAALAVTNAVAIALFVFHSPMRATDAQPEPLHAPTVVPPQPPGQPPQSNSPTGTVAAEPWSYGTLSAVGDPDRFPKSEPIAGRLPPDAPLTVLAARRGEID